MAEKLRRRIEDHPFPGQDTQPDRKVTVNEELLKSFLPEPGSARRG